MFYYSVIIFVIKMFYKIKPVTINSSNVILLLFHYCIIAGKQTGATFEATTTRTTVSSSYTYAKKISTMCQCIQVLLTSNTIGITYQIINISIPGTYVVATWHLTYTVLFMHSIWDACS